MQIGWIRMTDQHMATPYTNKKQYIKIIIYKHMTYFILLPSIWHHVIIINPSFYIQLYKYLSVVLHSMASEPVATHNTMIYFDIFN